MTLEEEERKILETVWRAYARTKTLDPDEHHQAYVEFVVAHNWIHRLAERRNDRTIIVTLTKEILATEAGLLYACALSNYVANADAEKDEIADGVPFEYDGSE